MSIVSFWAWALRRYVPSAYCGLSLLSLLACVSTNCCAADRLFW